MKLDSWFATPVALDKLNKPEEFNSVLKDYVLAVEKNNEEKNTVLTQAEKKGLFESQWDLFDRDVGVIQELKKEIYNRLLLIVGRLNDYNQEIISSLKVEDQTWFHVTRKGGYFTSHNHPMASWSSVYCVDEGEINVKDDSGVTRFFSPNSTNGYLDAGNVNLIQPFNNSSINIKLKTGDLIFFPSNLLHEVSPYMGSKERITIASNFWIDSKHINIRV